MRLHPGWWAGARGRWSQRPCREAHTYGTQGPARQTDATLTVYDRGILRGDTATGERKAEKPRGCWRSGPEARAGSPCRLEHREAPGLGACQTGAGTTESSRPREASVHDGGARTACPPLQPPLVPCLGLLWPQQGREVRPMSRAAGCTAAPDWPRGALAWAPGAAPEPGLPKWGWPWALAAHITLPALASGSRRSGA